MDWRAVDWNSGVARIAMRTLLVGLACAGSGVAHADGSPTPAPPPDLLLTHFESFILNNCVPCVRESYYIATVPCQGAELSGGQHTEHTREHSRRRTTLRAVASVPGGSG